LSDEFTFANLLEDLAHGDLVRERLCLAELSLNLLGEELGSPDCADLLIGHVNTNAGELAHVNFFVYLVPNGRVDVLK
jgi:hypothetical protein